MTVHARGYRAYEGRMSHSPAALAIAREGIRTAWARKSFRRVGILYLLWFGMLAFFLYLSMSGDLFRVGRQIERIFPGEGGYSLILLNTALNFFYSFLSYLTALLAVFVGAPLVADDLQAGALPLYLVRPIRALDYVAGKALVVPSVLAVMLVLPGVFFYVLMGVWQPPGETFAFLSGNLDVLGRVGWHALVSSAAYTGLMLILSSRTPRRAVAAGVAGAVLFAGVMIHIVGENTGATGFVGDLFLHANLPWDTVTVFHGPSVRLVERSEGASPNPEVVIAVAAVLLSLGLFFTWRRARSVEVTG